MRRQRTHTARRARAWRADAEAATHTHLAPLGAHSLLALPPPFERSQESAAARPSSVVSFWPAASSPSVRASGTTAQPAASPRPRAMAPRPVSALDAAAPASRYTAAPCSGHAEARRLVDADGRGGWHGPVARGCSQSYCCSPDMAGRFVRAVFMMTPSVALTFSPHSFLLAVGPSQVSAACSWALRGAPLLAFRPRA